MERDRVYLPKTPPFPPCPASWPPCPASSPFWRAPLMAFFITNGKAVPIWVNHSYEVISGLSAQDVLGIPMDELVRRGLISNSATLQALEIGHSYTANQSFVTGKQALVTSTPIYDENDQVCLVVTNVRDISELVSLQETLDQQRRLSSRYQQEIEVIRNQLLGSSQMVAEDPATPKPAAHRGRPPSWTRSSSSKGRPVPVRSASPPTSISTPPGPEELHPGQLRCHPREFGRKRTLRLRAGCLHRRQPGGGRPASSRWPTRGTIFLDEVGELSWPPKPSSSGSSRSGNSPGWGGSKPISIDVRVIAATNRDLQNASPRAPSERTSTTASASFPSVSRPCGAEVGHSQTGPLGDRRAQPDL